MPTHAIRTVTSLLLISAVAAPLAAECSDSGFCRLPSQRGADPAMKKNGSRPVRHDDSIKISAGVRIGYAAGNAGTKAAKDDVTYTSVSAELGWSPWDGAQATAGIPWVRASGDRGNAAGLGDVLIGFNQELSRTSVGIWSASFGVRLPTGDDAKLDSAPLGYQPGLGSTDVIVALGWNHRGFDARIGYIAALDGNDTPGIELERGDDLAAAAGYTLPIDAVALRGGLQATHRLADSTVTNGLGGRTTIDDSAGTQVNLQLGAHYAVHRHVDLGLDAAFGLLSRPDNAGIDGLTRSRSVALSATYNW